MGPSYPLLRERAFNVMDIEIPEEENKYIVAVLYHTSASLTVNSLDSGDFFWIRGLGVSLSLYKYIEMLTRQENYTQKS